MLSVYLALIDEPSDKEKFERLYLTYRQDMYSIAYSILHNSFDAEDAVQQAFLAIANNYKKISSLSGQEIRRCFVIIIRNASINIYNGNKRRTERTTELDDSTPMKSDFFEKFDLDDLKNAILKLPQIYKDVIYLQHIYGFTVKEISKMLGISKETVWKRTERAKKILKSILEEDGCDGR